MFSEGTIMSLENAADEEIDLSFLFDLDEATIKKNLVNKKIKILDEEYKITYNEETKSVDFVSNKNKIIVSLTLKLLYINDELLSVDNNLIYNSDLNNDDFELIKSFVKAVSILLADH